MRPLFKHTIIIWAEEDLTQDTEPASHWTEDPVVLAAKESYDGHALCAQFSSELVQDPLGDSTFPDTDFFESAFTATEPEETD